MVAVPATVHDPQRIVVTYGVVPLVGLAPGRFLDVRRDANTWTSVDGTNGEFKRYRTRKRSGTIQLTLRGTAPVNRLLSVLLKADEGQGGILLPIAVTDTLNGGLFIGANAYIEKFADKTYSSAEVDTTWTFRCDDLDMTHPGTSLESLGIRLRGDNALS